jgi:hypothetical protein
MRRGAVAPADVVGRLSSPPVRQGSAQRERESRAWTVDG